jgi:hypothetical protein
MEVYDINIPFLFLRSKLCKTLPPKRSLHMTEKEFAYLHCGKYLVQMISTLLASTSCFPFEKIILSNNVINYG